MTINRPPVRRGIIVMAIFFCALNAFSQKKNNYSLLWRISGKGMDKPSFLFGTMHVKDRRVFNFSDSVMLSLQSCSAFALEVHPDTVISKIFALIQSNDSLRSLDKLLNKEQYKKFAKKFKDKNGYPMGKTDPLLLESLMKPDNNKPDDEVSFVDAYLYGIARTLNKGIRGLEDASSQVDQYYGSKEVVKERLLDLLDEDEEHEKDEANEEMVKIYSSGDLDAIYKYIVKNSVIDSELVARNKVMANSIEKYIAGEQLFAAVGAAHLPGPDGVIALLRRAGYQVTCVPAGFTGVASSFHIDYLKMNWPLYQDESMRYSVSFPGTPIKNTLYGFSNVIYPDLANEVYYGLYAIPNGTDNNPVKRQELISKMLVGLNKNNKGQVLKRKDFLFNTMPCTELLMKISSGYMRMRIIFKNNVVYSVYAGAKLNRLKQPIIDRYLNSFAVLPMAKKTPASWVSFVDTTGAFAIKVPEQPQVITKDIPSKVQTEEVTFKLNMYLSNDLANANSYLIRYNDYPSGTYLKDRELIFSSLINEFKGKGKIIGSPLKIWKNQVEGREIKVVLAGGYYTTVRIYVRGNRLYMLLKEVTQADLKDDGQNNTFFDSFEFIPYAEPHYYAYQSDSANFQVKMVSKPKTLPVSTEHYTSYLTNTVTTFATNPNSGGFYEFEYSKISPYYRITDVDSLYKQLEKRLIGYSDSLLKTDTILFNGVKVREMLTINKETGIKERFRIIIDDNNFFCFTGKMDAAELFDKTTNTVYNSLKVVHHSTPQIDLASSKAQKICDDLGSTDSTVYKSALGALSYYHFTPSELPPVYAALQKNYPDDTLAEGCRSTLIKTFDTVNDDSTVNVLTRLYHQLNDKDVLQGTILTILPRINKKAGYDTYLRLLTTEPPAKAQNVYGIFEPLIDSVELSYNYFERVLPLNKYPNYRKYILQVAKNIANKENPGYDKMLKTNYSTIMAYGRQDINNYIKLKDSTKNEWNGFLYTYMQLMSKVKIEAINDELTRVYIQTDPNGLYAPDALVARVYNDLPNSSTLVNKFLDSIGTRYDLMTAYDSQKQLNKVPPKYRTQVEYAKLCLYQEVSGDDYGSPTDISLLGNIVKNGYVYYVFKYSLPDREDKHKLIGITGPYKTGSTKLNFKRYFAYSAYDIVKPNWRLQASKMIKPLIEAYKN